MYNEPQQFTVAPDVHQDVSLLPGKLRDIEKFHLIAAEGNKIRAYLNGKKGVQYDLRPRRERVQQYPHL